MECLCNTWTKLKNNFILIEQEKNVNTYIEVLFITQKPVNGILLCE